MGEIVGSITKASVAENRTIMYRVRKRLDRLARLKNAVAVVAASTLFLENFVDAEHGGDYEGSNGVVVCNRRGDVQHVVICCGQQFFADAGPFLRHPRKFCVALHETEIPTRPFSLERARDLVVRIKNVELSAD